MPKASQALKRYGHKLVIANELNTRKNRVILVSEKDHEEIIIKNDENVEIESIIVNRVIERHNKYIVDNA